MGSICSCHHGPEPLRDGGVGRSHTSRVWPHISGSGMESYPNQTRAAHKPNQAESSGMHVKQTLLYVHLLVACHALEGGNLTMRVHFFASCGLVSSCPVVVVPSPCPLVPHGHFHRPFDDAFESVICNLPARFSANLDQVCRPLQPMLSSTHNLGLATGSQGWDVSTSQG